MTEGRDIWFHEALAAADPECPAEPLDAEHPLYVLYTSGSTAKPKGILHTTGGYLTGVAATTKYVFDLKPEEDVYWCSADVGWVTGHSYIVYGPLMNGVTSVMYEGAPDYPDKDIWWRLCDRYDVTSSTRRRPRSAPASSGGPSTPPSTTSPSFACSGRVGEPINPKAWVWYHRVIGGGRCPIVDTWWQTETGHIMITTLPGVMSTEARVRGPAAARDRRRRGGRGRQRGRRPGSARAAPAVAGDAAHALQGPRPLRGDLLLEVRPDHLLRGRRRPPRRGWLLLGDRPRGRRDQRVRAIACPRPRWSRRSSRTPRWPSRR